MIMIVPIKVNDSNLLLSNVPESEYTAWSPTTTYALGSPVRVVGPNSHKIYESLQAGNVGHSPALSPSFWLYLGTTNRWAMFDASVENQTKNTNTIDVTISAVQSANSVALLNVSAATARVIVTDSSGVVIYDKTASLAPGTSSAGTSWYYYFYPQPEDVARKTYLIFNDLPTQNGVKIRVILTDTGSTVALGELIVGNYEKIGDTQYGSKVGVVSYSVKSRDDFGDYTIVSRSFSKTGTFLLEIDASLTDYIAARLTGLRDTPVFWSGSEDYQSMMIYGFYKELSINFSNPKISNYTLEIEGLT